MAHHVLTAAEPSMGSLTPSSLLYFPDLLATPPPPLSFACALLTHSLRNSAFLPNPSVLDEGRLGESGESYSVTQVQIPVLSFWRVEGVILADLHTPFIRLWEILSKHLIVF